MSGKDELISFEIFNQRFQIRAAPEEREAIERVAADVDARMREHKRHATSDLRAALMTAYALCFERDECAPIQSEGEDPAKALSTIEKAADDLLARIDKEMDFSLESTATKNEKKTK